ncbi:Pre-mRNA-splicing factor ATP-dependent RNA helicase prp22 [Lasiodiplodia hormozganensis]|uniref:RNA helicase n=1 Tax=Lasiodiplodia hormozganensis TaxID=869390 RepID=A0AA39Z1N8_9PEZI|nr:Pre-mRNA-splicing factor ATP-dependent RNA helicase prp22 [Lasiodiplodia hormozganensis]
MDDLSSLELLSLVSKVTSELDNHIHVADKTLAEFIIDQHLQCKSLDEFKAKLVEIGAEDFPPSLVESIDRLVLTMHPKFKKSNGAGRTVQQEEKPEDERERKARVFKGLAIADQEVPKPYDDSALLDEDAKEGGLDDTFAMLENLAGKAGNGGTSSTRKRSPSPYKDESYSRSKTKRSRRSRSRSRSPYRSRHQSNNDDYMFEDEFGRSRPAKDLTRTRERDYDRHDDRRGRHRRRHDYDDDFRDAPLPEIDDAPVVHKIYNGRVTGLKPYGAFVRLHGVKGRVDGLVHVSRMAEGRVNDPSDLLSRDQEVKVKVTEIKDGKISLTMKEVDQTTGEDLAPELRVASGANSEGLGGRLSNGRYGNLGTEAPIASSNFSGPPPAKKRYASPERWEIQQMISAGQARASDYPGIYDTFDNVNEHGMLEEELDVDIEVKEEEPPFLVGQTKQSLELSPIRVVKAPDGSLNRAAMSGEQLAKERKELRAQEEQDKKAAEASRVDLSAQWNDPMAGPDDRKFASDYRAAPSGQSNEPLPEWKKITQGKTETGKRTNMSIKDQREGLPVFKFRNQLLQAVREHQLLILVGDTGSGKTTQLTQYLAEDGFANNGMIGCTQPRRVAAMSVAKRVAEEVGCKLGAEVGYTIRFEDCTSPDTKIKYMTDGIMQREILLDPMLNKYSVIILDEAHERTIATDVLFGLLKKTLKRRPDMKVIVTSATLDADKFSEYFNKCPIFSIPGRTYPVEIMYSKEPESDYLDAALTTVMQIHLTEPPGDILLFLTGKEEIDTSCEILFERMKALGPGVPELVILPIYGALPSEVASRIFEPPPPGGRKVVIATNIAETSITIDGIYFVVDPGFVKQTAYDPKLGMDRLQVTPISQAQAKQRAGRAGRTGPGKCFRLYTEAAFQSEMLPTTIPEIQRQNLSNTILMLKAMGINDLLGFDFMDPPPTNTMLTALEELYALGALDEEGLLTQLGRQMADFPMDPALSKSLIMSVKLKCSDEMLTIVSMISATQTVFHRPRDKQQQADNKRLKFNDPHGDHLTLLNVYNAWKHSKFSVQWCYENFIQPKAMKRVADVRDQLTTIMKRYKSPIVSCGRDTQAVRKALCSGFFRNAARKDATEGYKTLVEGNTVYMHPSSALFRAPAEHVIYNSVVETQKEYMHILTAIEPKWLVEAAPRFFQVAPTDRLSKRKRAERIQPLQSGKDAEGDAWRLSAQRKGGRGGGGTWG